MSKVIKKMARSVHDRLLKQAREDGRPFNELLQYFAMDRFLYRWSKSPHAGTFILKGALMLKVWKTSEYRPTMDIDLLGKIKNEKGTIVAAVKDVIGVKVDDDGLVFHADSVEADDITKDTDYLGMRVTFDANLGSAKIAMQIDVGFGDAVYPGPQKTVLPAMLDFPPGELLCYSRESAIAEKFEAAVSLGEANSRMKDFFDIRALSRQFPFDGKALAEAIRITFKTRKTELPSGKKIFAHEFAQAKQVQWTAFRKKLDQDFAPESFGEVLDDVERFLEPLTTAMAAGSAVPSNWTERSWH